MKFLVKTLLATAALILILPSGLYAKKVSSEAEIKSLAQIKYEEHQEMVDDILGFIKDLFEDDRVEKEAKETKHKKTVKPVKKGKVDEDPPPKPPSPSK